jgi:hypothetical protein
LRSRPAASPGTRPEPTDVEIPVLHEGFTRRGSTDAPGNAFASSSSAPSSPSFTSSAPASVSLTGDDEHDDDPQPSTQAIDIQDLFDRANAGANATTGSALAFEQPSATTTTASPAAESTAPVGDTIDAEALDDDAFFATLREAVHDETPLGPRDDLSGEDMFFDAEAESSGFRDVFRRRR